MARLKIRVSTRSSNAGLFYEDGALKARLHAPPTEGRANDELIDLVAKKLRLRKSDLIIVRGTKSRDKEIEVAGMDQEQIDNLVRNLA